MPDDTVTAAAKAAGLDLALASFPADVAAAAASAAGAVSRLVLPPDRAAEPWPPMRMGPLA